LQENSNTILFFREASAYMAVARIDQFRFLANMSFWPKFPNFDQYFYYWTRFRFFTKIYIFKENSNFDFWPNFLCLAKISTFDKNFDFWPKFLSVAKILIFSDNFAFRIKFYFVPEFFTNIFSFEKIFYVWP